MLNPILGEKCSSRNLVLVLSTSNGGLGSIWISKLGFGVKETLESLKRIERGEEGIKLS